MSNYSIYLRSEDNAALLREAKAKGKTPVELLKKRIENHVKDENFKALQAKLDALFLLVEMLAAEIGYTSGATRAASANAPKAMSEGTALESSLKKAVQTLRSRLQQQGAEVRL